MGDEWDGEIHDREDLYRQASEQWGDDAQLAKAAEEFAELSAVCARELNGQADRDAVLEELVDARLMLEQLAMRVPDDALEDAVDDALDGLADRVEVFGGAE